MAEIYGSLVAARLRALAGAPRLLALRCAGDVLIVGMEAVVAIVLVGRFGSIAGWTGAEVALLVGVGRAGESLAGIVGRGLDATGFGDKIRLGQFDQILTRPVRPLVWLLTSEVEVRFVVRALAAVAIIVWSASHAGVAATPANVAVLAGATLAVAVFVLATLVLGAALTFRTVDGSDIAAVLANGGLGIVSFPYEVYASPLRFVFTFLVPVGLCVYVPVLTVLGRDGPGVLGPALLPALPVVLGAFAGVAALAWRAGLSHYESTGS